MFIIALLETIEGPINCTDGDIRLYGGQYEGVLHMCVNKAWSTVCWRNTWSAINTDVVCAQLGYSTYGIYLSYN